MTKEEFLDVYEREATSGDKSWRETPLSEAVCRELLNEGFSPETLLLLKRTPLGILKLLAHSADPRIRRGVADKRAAAPLLDQLARDHDAGVRMRVCYNAKVSVATLERLAHDPDADVRRAATRPRS